MTVHVYENSYGCNLPTSLRQPAEILAYANHTKSDPNLWRKFSLWIVRLISSKGLEVVLQFDRNFCADRIHSNSNCMGEHLEVQQLDKTISTAPARVCVTYMPQFMETVPKKLKKIAIYEGSVHQVGQRIYG